MIAAQAVKQAKPDGYTLLFSPSAGMAGGKFLYANLPVTIRRRISSSRRAAARCHASRLR